MMSSFKLAVGIVGVAMAGGFVFAQAPERIAFLATAPREAKLLSMAFSPDGKTIATGHQDNLVRIWDARSGEPQRTLRGQHHYVEAIAFSPDGKLIATGGYMSRALVVFEAASGKVLLDVEGNPDRAVAVAFSPDGKSLVCGGGSRVIRMWNTKTFQQTGEFAAAGGWELAYSPEGKWLAAMGPFCVELIDVNLPGRRRRLEIPDGVHGPLEFSADGRVLAVASGTGITVWEMSSGKVRRSFEIDRKPYGVSIARGGRFMATAVERSVHLLDLHDGKTSAVLEASHGWVHAAAFSQDGLRLAMGDGNLGQIFDLSKLVKAREPVKLGQAELEQRWEALAGDDASKAYDAVVKLGAAGESAGAFLAERMCAAVRPESQRLAELIAKLDAQGFVERERAIGELARLGTLAEPALAKALEQNPSAQVKSVIEGLRAKGKEFCESPEELRLLRAIEALEISNDEQARRALRTLEKDWPAGRLKDEAEQIMRRMR